MIVQAEDMAKAVRVAIDMNHNSTPLLADEDVDTESFDEIIYAKLCDAVRMVEMEAPLNLLEQGHLFGDAVTWLDGGKGWILLPDDFMRTGTILFRKPSHKTPRHIPDNGRSGKAFVATRKGRLSPL